MAVDTSIALITLAQAKAFLKIPNGTTAEDVIISDLVNNASQQAAQYCGRRFVSETYTEYYDGDGSDKLIVKNYPIISVTSLHDDTNRLFQSYSEIDVSANVLLESGAGIVRLWNEYSAFSKGKANIKIVYVAGYTTIPYSLQHAALLIVMYTYKRQYQDQRIGLQSETIGDRNMTYSNEDIPKAAKTILDTYKSMGAATHGY